MLQIWDVNWYLDVEQCPCDVHFVEWMREQKVSSKTVFHFGTGGHHHLGLANHAEGAPNTIEHATLSRNYQVMFGDIYLLNTKLLPRLDIVTLFHLCEFRGDSQDAYGGLTDAEVVDTLLKVMPKGGIISLYTRSFAFDKADAIARTLVEKGVLEPMPKYKSLDFYRKT